MQRTESFILPGEGPVCTDPCRRPPLVNRTAPAGCTQPMTPIHSLSEGACGELTSDFVVGKPPSPPAGPVDCSVQLLSRV